MEGTKKLMRNMEDRPASKADRCTWWDEIGDNCVRSCAEFKGIGLVIMNSLGNVLSDDVGG